MDDRDGVGPSHVARAAAIVGLVAAAFAFVGVVKGAVFAVFAGVVLGTALRPWVEALSDRVRLTRRQAAVAVYASLLGLSALALVLFVPAIVEQASNVVADLPRHVETLRERLLESSSGVVRRLARELPSRPTPAPGSAPRAALGLLPAVPHALLTGVGVLLIGYYWLVEREGTIRALLFALPADRREGTRSFLEAAEEKVGGYVRGQLLTAGCTVALATLGYLAVGVPDALSLGVFFGVMGVVPVFGAPLGALPAALVALSSAPRLLPWVVVHAAIVHVLQDYVIAPRVMSQRVGVDGFTVLISIVAFGALLGVGGAILAIPLAAIAQLVLDRLVFEEPSAAPPSRDRLSVLQLRAKELAADARRQGRTDGEPAAAEVEDAVEAIARDLEEALARGARA